MHKVCCLTRTCALAVHQATNFRAALHKCTVHCVLSPAWSIAGLKCPVHSLNNLLTSQQLLPSLHTVLGPQVAAEQAAMAMEALAQVERADQQMVRCAARCLQIHLLILCGTGWCLCPCWGSVATGSGAAEQLRVACLSCRTATCSATV